MIRKFANRFSSYRSSGDPFADIGISFATAFLAIIFYSFYRQRFGFSITVLSPSVTGVYWQFLLLFLILGLALFFFFCVILRRSDLLDLILLVGSVAVSVLVAGFSPQSFAFCLVLFLLMGMLLNFYFVHRNRSLLTFSKTTAWLVGALTLIYVLSVIALAFLKHWSFFSYDLDLGYFDQVFYSMTQSFKPVYTIMGRPINHFQNNHFSPLLYLLLPGYLLFPSAEYLIVIQAIFVGLAVIPLYQLCTAYRLEKKVILLICAAFLLQPGIIGGQLYDFHENALLPFFLFGLLYFLTVRNRTGIFLSLVLTLLIKEDAVLYTIAIGLFELLRPGGSKKTAVWMIVISAVYFMLVSNLILNTAFFHNRYENLIDSGAGGSYLDIVKILFTNPLYLFTQSFTADKVLFLGLIFLPLALIPLAGLCHLSEISLFLPMVAINLLPSWWPQYSIDYQYNFGTIPLLVLICIRFLASLRKPPVRVMLAALMTVSALIFSVSFHIEKYDYVIRYREHQTELQAMALALEKIPADASVSAASHMVPHLSGRDEIYTFGVKNDTDFVLLDLRSNGVYVGDTYQGEIFYLSAIEALLENQGYGVADYFESWFVLLQKDTSGPLDEEVKNFLQYRIRKLRGEFDG